MNIQRWVARREAAWQQFNDLLQRAEKKRLRSFRAEEIKQLASLYRSVTADLARARTHQVGQTLVRDLQNLTSRGYSQIYQGSRYQEWQAVVKFYQWDFPEVVQRTFIYTALAIGIFLTGALIAWWFSWQDPVFMSAVIQDEGLITKVRDKGELWMGNILGRQPLASSSIMINNMTVAFQVIAGGMVAGLFTVYALAQNGLLIGAIATLVGQNNLAYPFWAFVFLHGALELPAIFLAGGAGLLIAKSLLFPGQFRRADAIKFYGLQAAQLIYGIVPMLFIAGIIEGFFSPSPLIAEPIKYLVGLSLFSLLLLYCNRRRRSQQS